MEGHEARAAMSALDGQEMDGSLLRVSQYREPARGRRSGRR
jgi:hypothetical protein